MKLDGIRFEGGTGMSRLWEMISSRVFNCLLIALEKFNKVYKTSLKPIEESKFLPWPRPSSKTFLIWRESGV